MRTLLSLTDRIQLGLQIVQRQFFRRAGLRFPHSGQSSFGQSQAEGNTSRVDGLPIKEPNRLGGSQADFSEDILRELLIPCNKPHIDAAESGTLGFRNARTYRNTSSAENHNAISVTSKK